MKINLSGPDITKKEIDAVVAVLKTRSLSLGPKLPAFEAKLAQYAEAKHAIAVNSGTSGLHLCVRSLGIKDDDEVITTPFSFVASANCILFERGRPVFVDIDPETLNIDYRKIEAAITARTKAILPVHIFGYPCRMDEILKIAEKHNLKVIEDACEAIGATFNGRKVGAMGDCGVFAFYPNKQITTGEGGMIVTNDDKIANMCRSMRNQGRDPSSAWLEHREMGFNYRISDINCALGIAQMERIDNILEKRSSVASMYKQRLESFKQLKLLARGGADISRSWFVYVVRLDKKFSREDRDIVIAKLRKLGIECGIYFPCIHLQPFCVKKFGYKRGDFPVAEGISDRTIALPFYNNLKEKDIDYVCENLKDIITKLT